MTIGSELQLCKVEWLLLRMKLRSGIVEVEGGREGERYMQLQGLVHRIEPGA
jgi:hypothetical protein